MRNRFRVVVAVVAALAIVMTGASSAQAIEWYGWKFLGTRCLEQTSPAYQITTHRARVGVRMWVSNKGIGRHWATNMRVKTRLVSDEIGLDIDSPWTQIRYTGPQGQLLQDHNYSNRFTITSNPLGVEHEWRVQIKLIWDRQAPFHDVVNEYEFPLNCSTNVIVLG